MSSPAPFTNGLSGTSVNVGATGNVTTNSEAAQASGSNGKPAAKEIKPQDVGWQFVPQYYTFLFNSPQRLHCFYTKKSTFIHGVEGEEVKPCYGQQEIDEKIKSLNLHECKTFISSIDAQGSADGGIIIQCIGEMSNNSGPFRKFSQTFFLAEQPNGYFVLNDIFRYLKEEGEDAEETSEDVEDVGLVSEETTAVNAVQQEDEVSEVQVPAAEEEDESEPEPVQTAAVVIDAPHQADQTEPEQSQTAVYSEPAANGAPIKVEEQPVSMEEPAPAAEVAETSREPEQMETASEPPAAEEVQLAPVETAEPVAPRHAAASPSPVHSPAIAPTSTPKIAEKPATSTPPAPQTPAQPPKPAGPKTWASLAAAGKTAWGNLAGTSASKEASSSSPAPAAVPAATPAPAPAQTTASSSGVSQHQGGVQKGLGGQGGPPRPHNKLDAAQRSQTPICFVKLNNWQAQEGVDAVDEEALESMLRKFGEILKVEIVKNKACAFVEFKQVESARKAIIASLLLNEGGGGGILAPDGQRIIVESRKDKEERNNKGGPAGNREQGGGRRGPSGGSPNGGPIQGPGSAQVRPTPSQQAPAGAGVASDDQGFIPAGKPARTQQGGNRGGKSQRGGKTAGEGRERNAAANTQK